MIHNRFSENSSIIHNEESRPSPSPTPSIPSERQFAEVSGREVIGGTVGGGCSSVTRQSDVAGETGFFPLCPGHDDSWHHGLKVASARTRTSVYFGLSRVVLLLRKIFLGLILSGRVSSVLSSVLRLAICFFDGFFLSLVCLQGIFVFLSIFSFAFSCFRV